MSELDAIFTLLKKLSDSLGPSGHEDEVREIVIEELKPLVDKIQVDKWGNVYGVRYGARQDIKVMIAAHMDEIGLMIDKVDKNGFLRFRQIGGWTEAALIGKRVAIKSRDGKKVKGVIGLRPPHATPPGEERKLPEIKDMYIDVGVSSREEAEKLGITPGCVAVLDVELMRLSANVVTGKALDDRAGLAAMIWAARLLKGKTPPVTVYFVATVQEEIGLRGAGIASERVHPSYAIAVDTTLALDVPGVPNREQTIRLGKGPAVKFMDGGRLGMFIAHPRVRQHLVDVAEREKIPYQIEILLGGTTDATAIAFRREGVPAGGVSIPARYIHSPIEVVSLEDVLNTAKLLAKAIEHTDEKLIQDLSEKEY